ncbi:zinc ribbon domain-containing protein [Okeania sp. KiyG1]|uniref:RNA-guided endonuclease InsQ/TnpB family protein n=1 Tax=Okeania sp. KiyG1 TaxID=2720165 RepID=UPI001F360A73|nr:zinc ribbon domain-containing protein [Okeania sp. KiyG1]
MRENQTVVLEDLNVSGMIKNRKLSRAISDLGWRQFRTFLEGKAEKYGRDFRVIDRWEPTTSKCSCCGFKGAKLDLQVQEWKCLNCGSKHVLRRKRSDKYISRGPSGGTTLTETKNGRRGKRQTSVKVAAANVSGALRQQNVNPLRSYSSVGIPAPLGRGGCQNLLSI